MYATWQGFVHIIEGSIPFTLKREAESQKVFISPVTIFAAS